MHHALLRLSACSRGKHVVPDVLKELRAVVTLKIDGLFFVVVLLF